MVVLLITAVIVICVVICLRKRRSKLGEKTKSVNVSDSVAYGVSKSAMESSSNTATNGASFQQKPVIYDYISTTDGNGINITSSPNEAYRTVPCPVTKPMEWYTTRNLERENI